MGERATRPDAEVIHDPGWVRFALLLWILLALAVCIKTFISPDERSVFPKMSARAVNWWSGQPLYEKYEDLGRFPYPPVFAIGLAPFALPGNQAGGILWSLASIGVYVWGLRRLASDVLPGEWPAIKVGAFLVLAMLGAVRGLWNAQSNALIIGLLMIGIAAMARQRWWWAAFLLGAPAWIKVWPLVIGLLLAARYPARLAWRLPVALAVYGLIPFLTQPYAVVLEQYAGWLAYLAEMSEDLVGSYRDAWTVLMLLEVPIEQPLYRAIQAATGLAIAGWCLWQSRPGTPLRWQLTSILAMGSAWLMVLGPAVEYNTFVVLAPSVSWALLAANEARDRAARGAAWNSGLGTADGELKGPLPGEFAMGDSQLAIHPTGARKDSPTRSIGARKDSRTSGSRTSGSVSRARSCFWLALAAYLTTMLLGWGSIERAVSPVFPAVLLTLPVGTMLFIIWLVRFGRRCGV